MRSILVALVFIAGFIVAAPPAEADEPVVEKLPAGRTVLFAAELGTTPDLLGMGVERNLATVDANGDAHRAYEAKVTEVPVSQYDAKFEMVENNLAFEAHGRYLFVEAGIKASVAKRYMVVRVYQVNKLAKLSVEGKPLANAPMYASRIYYGWALYVVIEGEASSFTTDVAAKLMRAGGKLSTEIETNHLTSRVHLIGLQPKNPGDIPIAVTAADVQTNFTTGADQPIFVEYTLMQDTVVDAIPWVQNTVKPGRYAVNVDLAVMESKDDGRPWDVGSLPDPTVTLFVNGAAVTSCKQQDSMESHCLHDRVIDVDETTRMSLSVKDADLSSDDYIGEVDPFTVMSSERVPGTPFDLRTKAQLRWAKVTLTAVR